MHVATSTSFPSAPSQGGSANCQALFHLVLILDSDLVTIADPLTANSISHPVFLYINPCMYTLADQFWNRIGLPPACLTPWQPRKAIPSSEIWAPGKGRGAALHLSC